MRGYLALSRLLTDFSSLKSQGQACGVLQRLLPSFCRFTALYIPFKPGTYLEVMVDDKHLHKGHNRLHLRTDIVEGSSGEIGYCEVGGH